MQKLSTLLALRFTNVADAIGNLFFALGRDQGFNVFDRGNKVVYYGHFYRLRGAEIVKRVRILIGRLHDTIHKVMNAPEDPRRDHLLSLLQRAQIVVLIPGDLEPPRLESKVATFQPEDWRMPVKALTPEGLEEVFREELDRMDPERPDPERMDG